MDWQQAWDQLGQRGYRKTQQRMIVVKEVFAGGCLQGAEEILSRCREKDGGISMPTVYRTLDMLVDAGLVRRVNLGLGRTWFEPGGPDDDHHHHLVCEQCGKREKIALCPLGIVENEAKRSGFKVRELHFEAVGLCRSCAAKERKK